MSLTKRLFIVFATALAVVAILTSSDEPPQPHITYQELVELDAPLAMPELAFIDENKTLTRFSEMKGEPRLTVVHLWASWCTPCIVELPELDKSAARYGHENVRFIPLSITQDDYDSARRMYQKLSIRHLPFYSEKGTNLMQGIKSHSLPETLILNGDNQIIARTFGVVDWKKDPLRRWLK